MSTHDLYHTDVLDKGYVTLIDIMGTDDDIADAARCSISGEGVSKVSSNMGLLRYLMRHRHTSPFEMAELKFRVKVPIFVWRQWIRHRTANVNEMSGRYSELPAEWYEINSDDIKQQSKGNNQGGDGLYPGRHVAAVELDVQAADAFAYYQKLLKEDVARETARIGLPLSTYTVAIWKIDLHNLLHFLALRLHSHAQFEIRRYAQAIAEIVEAKFPITWEAFVDFRLNSMALSWHDQVALAKEFANKEVTGADFPTEREWREWQDKRGKISTLTMIQSIKAPKNLTSASGSTDSEKK